jgi:hypothetical protein
MGNKKVTDISTRRKKRYKPLNQIVKEELGRCLAIAAAIEEPDALASGRSIFEQPEEEDDGYEDEKSEPHDGS